MVLERALRRVGFGLPRGNQTLALSLLAVALLTSLASSVFNLYEKFWWLDEALHSYFTFSLTLMLALYAYGKVLTGHHQHRILLVLSTAGLRLACGSLWEIAKWGYDQTVSSEAIYGTTNPITDMSDTMTDLIMNLAGRQASNPARMRREPTPCPWYSGNTPTDAHPTTRMLDPLLSISTGENST